MQNDGDARPLPDAPAPILALSEHDWNPMMGSTVQSLLPRLAARGWSVLHSAGALSVWQRGSRDWDDAPLFSRLEDIKGVRVERTGKVYSRWPRWPAWDRWIVNRHAARLRAAIAPRGARIVLILYHPRYYPYVRSLRPRSSGCLFVFHRIDSYLDQPGATPELRDMLEHCVAECDLLISNNRAGAARLPEPGPSKARLLPSGVDLATVEAGLGRPCPQDLQAIPHPRIGYVGRLNPKVDFAAIAATAERHPDWHWVPIGEVVMDPGNSFYAGVADAWAVCQRLPNVHFLGPKRFSEVPTYLEHMDVNTICYRLDAGAWTRAAYPFKIHECLAVGRPVVCAAMPEVQRRHTDVMGFAATPEEWGAALSLAIESGGIGTEKSRKAVAAQNTSDQRAELLDAWLRELAAQRLHGASV